MFHRASIKSFPVQVLITGSFLTLFAISGKLFGFTAPVSLTMLQWIGITLIAFGIISDMSLGSKWLAKEGGPFPGGLSDVLSFAIIALQVGLILLLTQTYENDSRAFYGNIMLLVFGGFIIHHILPLSWRMPFFVILGFTAIFSIFGLHNGFWFLGIGGVLILLTHLPVAFVIRVLLLISFGAVLAALRGGLIQAAWVKLIMPIIASLFMFRLIVYMYDMKHQKVKPKLVQTLCYFFMLPNFVFPLFPVVDFKTFTRTYYQGNPFKIYQTGLQWMLRGLIHLLIYRIANQYLIIAPENVSTLNNLFQYVTGNYVLLLRVTGQFHLSIGLLHLFGFDLPEVMHRLWLASSLTDYWRRANIYWKDFMQKVFFYPIYYRLRVWRPVAGLLISTAFVFVLTWLLHAYQWFWIRGTFLLTGPDMLFWAIFGVLVVVNSFYEIKRGRKRTLGKAKWSWREMTLRTVRVFVMFLLICVLWSLWISPTVQDWLNLWAGTEMSWGGLFEFLPVLLLTFIAFFVTIFFLERVPRSETTLKPKDTSIFRQAFGTGLAIIFLLLIGQPELQRQIGGKPAELFANIRTNRLNLNDAALLEKGYYENLTNVVGFNTQLWKLYMNQPDDWVVISKSEIAKIDHDFLALRLKPSQSINFHNKTFTTNRWGMRDKDYQKQRPAETYRFALLGASVTIGSGVADDEPFDAVLENKLNVWSEENAGSAKYEVLNFSIGGYGPVRRYGQLQDKVLAFQPNAVLFTAHARDYQHTMKLLTLRTRQGIEIPYAVLRNIVKEVGLSRHTTDTDGIRLLQGYEYEIIQWLYGEVVKLCKENNIVPVWILLPSGVGMYEPENYERLIDFAQQAGFVTVDLSDIFRFYSTDELRVAPWDWHPNAKGHQVIADNVFEFIIQNHIFTDAGHNLEDIVTDFE